MICIYEDQIQFCDKEGLCYNRLNGPAFIKGDYQAWYENGKKHRLDGPAVINGNYQAWWINGLRHRLDGPAFISGNYKEWYIKGEIYSKKQFNEKIKEIGLT